MEGGKIALPLLDRLSHFDQEADDHADHQDQEPQEKSARRGLRVPLVLSCLLMTPSIHEWTVKKTLTKSDVNDLCRLMLKTAVVQEHILTKWDVAQRNKVLETESGLRVNVLDINTDTEHKLEFKKWPSSGSFVFTNWKSQFVTRRGLKAGDEVGFHWDSAGSRFLFCVLAFA